MHVIEKQSELLKMNGLLGALLVTVLSYFLFSCSASSSGQMNKSSTANASLKAPSNGTPQASLTLKNSTAGLCYSASRNWSIAKDGSLSEGHVASWAVTSTKESLATATFKLNGVVTIQNLGSGEATIGSIVINLQRKSGNSWITASSDIVNATSADAATSALICSGASSEGRSSFSENAGSGSVHFTDVSNNTIFSLVPQKTLVAGEEVTLLFAASYNNAILGIPSGEQVRFEVIVTFGNAGARGGSGASCPGVDINGSGAIDLAENNVRSVPTRITLTVPAFYEHNQSVLLTDKSSSLSSTGTVSILSFLTSIGNGSGEKLISDSEVNSCEALVDTGDEGGSITNCATLDSPEYGITVNGPADPITLQPIYSYAFTCEPAFHAQACHTLQVAAPPIDNPPFVTNEYGTFTQGGWGASAHGNNPGALLASKFLAVFPSGSVKVGLAPQFSMTFSSAAAVTNYLPAGGPSNKLTANLVNPTTSASGVFGGQVLALKLSVSFGYAGFLGTSPDKFGDLMLKDTGYSIDGMTVSAVLAIAEQALGGGGLPYDMSFSQLNNIVTSLNEAFDNGTPTAWAQAHLDR